MTSPTTPTNDAPTPTDPPRVDVDSLPLAQYLILEVLRARHRLGEPFWPIPKRAKKQLTALQDAGLVSYESGVIEGWYDASLTPRGMEATGVKPLPEAPTSPGGPSGADTDALVADLLALCPSPHNPGLRAHVASRVTAAYDAGRAAALQEAAHADTCADPGNGYALRGWCITEAAKGHG